MRVGSLAASIIQPLRMRKKLSPKIPPWASDIPPDSVDIQLKPRINRYTQPLPRFNAFGTTRTKYEQRLALYMNHIDGALTKGVISPEEIKKELAKISQERIQKLNSLYEKHERLHADTPPKEAQETSAQEALTQETSAQEALTQETSAQEALTQEALAQEALAQEALAQEASAQEELLQSGEPTDWLLQRLGFNTPPPSDDPLLDNEQVPSKKKETNRIKNRR